MSRTPRPDLASRAYRDLRRRILATSDVCHICGHTGADQIDHLQAVSAGGSPYDPHNLRPAHGTRGCPTCLRKCNQAKGAGVAPTRVTSRAWL